jgi:hypothetical protein
LPAVRGVEGRFSGPHHDRQALLDRGNYTGGHLRGGVPVVGADSAAPMPAGAPGGLVAHHLVDDPSWDAGVLQPGREGVPEVVGAAQVHRVQQRLPGGWPQPPPPTRATAIDDAGRGQLAKSMADGGAPDRTPLGAQLGGELAAAERPGVTERF